MNQGDKQNLSYVIVDLNMIKGIVIQYKNETMISFSVSLRSQWNITHAKNMSGTLVHVLASLKMIWHQKILKRLWIHEKS